MTGTKIGRHIPDLASRAPFDLRKRGHDHSAYVRRLGTNRGLTVAFGCLRRPIDAGVYGLVRGCCGWCWWCPRQDSNLRHTI